MFQDGQDLFVFEVSFEDAEFFSTYLYFNKRQFDELNIYLDKNIPKETKQPWQCLGTCGYQQGAEQSKPFKPQAIITTDAQKTPFCAGTTFKEDINQHIKKRNPLPKLQFQVILKVFPDFFSSFLHSTYSLSVFE